jgi:hypothetical protein
MSLDEVEKMSLDKVEKMSLDEVDGAKFFIFFFFFFPFWVGNFFLNFPPKSYETLGLSEVVESI